MIETILKIAGLIGALGVIVGLLLKILHSLKAVQNGQLCLLRSAITDTYYKHNDAEEPELREYERKNLDDLYAGYHALHGNHFVDDIYKVMRTWRVIT